MAENTNFSFYCYRSFLDRMVYKLQNNRLRYNIEEPVKKLVNTRKMTSNIIMNIIINFLSLQSGEMDVQSSSISKGIQVLYCTVLYV